MKKILQNAELMLAVGRTLRLCAVLALSGAMATAMFAADGAHVRSHHAATQSAGAQETHGRIHETAATRRQERAALASRTKRRSSAAAAKHESAKSSRERASARKHVARGHSKHVEVAASHRRTKSSRKSSTEQEKIVAKATDSSEPKKASTVADFLRAARQKDSHSGSEIAAEGTSRPDASKKIETEHAKASDVAVRHDAQAERKPVAVVTAAVPRPVTPRRMVQGFGGEVDVAQGASRNTVREKKSARSRDEWKNEDAATQREIATAASRPMVVPLYTRSGKLITPAPLKGTHEILVHQNTMADQEGLARIQDDADLNRMRDAHLLARIPETAALDVNDALPANRRYARPWTVKFIGDLSRAYHSRFHDALRLNSAVRTVDFQAHLLHINGNAAPISGDTASPHLTGQAVDFGKKGMSRAEIAWMRAYLLPLMHEGKIDVEEEFQQSCFHISVYESYVPKKGEQRMDVAEGQ